MVEVASSFDGAWERFQARDSLRLAGDTLEGSWTAGRAQYLTFLMRVEDPGSKAYLSRVIERISGIPGVEPYPDTYWHITIKGAGFQVIKRTLDDDVLREDVPRIANAARELLSDEAAFEAQLGRANGFEEVVFVEVWQGEGFGALNEKLAQTPGVPGYPIDGRLLPHVSVARFTSNDGLAQLKEALAGLRAEEPGPAFPVRRVDFIKAWLSEDVPEFDTIATYPVRSAR